jgi:hypothetical protein
MFQEHVGDDERSLRASLKTAALAQEREWGLLFFFLGEVISDWEDQAMM